MRTVRDLHGALAWTTWRPLRDAAGDHTIPRSPGLYRLRRMGLSDLDYIGQTGLSLRNRLGALRGVYDQEMPYRDPHTAAPALWALHHAVECEFEVSVAPVEAPTPWRKGLEAVTIAVYRQEHRRSPTVEFGRMPEGYRPSSQNNATLVATGTRFRGGPCGESLPSHQAGIPPGGPLCGDPQGGGWGGYRWTDWRSLTETVATRPGAGTGLYRIRGDEHRILLYVGQGMVPARPLAHGAKLRAPNHSQGRVFARQERLECSWVVDPTWLRHHRLELANDLIAAHVLTTGNIPTVQFLG